MQLQDKAAALRRGTRGIGAELSHRFAAKFGGLSRLAEERFLILSHKQVLAYMQRKTSDYDRWFAGIRRLRPLFLYLVSVAESPTKEKTFPLVIPAKGE